MKCKNCDRNRRIFLTGRVTRNAITGRRQNGFFCLQTILFITCMSIIYFLHISVRAIAILLGVSNENEKPGGFGKLFVFLG